MASLGAVQPGRGNPSAVGARAAGARSRAPRHPPVHERVDERAQGRDDPRPGPRRQPRRPHRGGRDGRRDRRDGVVAAALPRHGSGRAADHVDDASASTWCRRPRRTSSPIPATGWSGSRPTAARPPPARTSRGCSPPGRCGGWTASTCRACASRSTAPSRSTPTPSRRSSRRRRRSASGPGAVFCAFGMAEVAIAGTFPPPMRGMRCDAVDRVVLEEKRVAEPADPGLDGTRRLPLLGRAGARASRSASSSRARARCWPSARSASSRSAARR